MLAVTLVVLLIASINFQLNLGYLFTFHAGGQRREWHALSHATLRGLTLHLKAAPTAIHGQQRALEVQLTSQRSTPRYGIGIAVHGGDDPSAHDHHWAWTDVPAQGQAVVHIAFQPRRRGLHPVPYPDGRDALSAEAPSAYGPTGGPSRSAAGVPGPRIPPAAIASGRARATGKGHATSQGHRRV